MLLFRVFHSAGLEGFCLFGQVTALLHDKKTLT